MPLLITQLWSDTGIIINHFYFSGTSQRNIYTSRPSTVSTNMLHATLIFFVLLSIHLSLRSFSAAACISRTLCNSTEWRCSTTFKAFEWCSSDFFSSKTRLSHFSLRLFLSAINWIKQRIPISFSIQWNNKSELTQRYNVLNKFLILMDSNTSAPYSKCPLLDLTQVTEAHITLQNTRWLFYTINAITLSISTTTFFIHL